MRRRRSGSPGLRVVLAVLLLGGGCTVDDGEVSGSGHLDYWRPSVSGHASITKASRPGTATSVSFRRDLDLGHDDALVGGVDVDLGPHRISFEYLDLAMDGDAIVPQDFIFHGQTYSQGDHVTSHLEVPTMRVDWRYLLWRNGASVWRAGLGARLSTFDLSIEDPAAGLDERRHFSHAYPLIASDSSFDLGHGLFARAGGDVAALSVQQEVFEVLAAAGYGTRHWTAELGWRFLRYDFNESTNDGDFNLSGPFVAAHVRF